MILRPRLLSAVLFCLLTFSATAHASNTSVTGNIGFGDDSTKTYTLSIHQQYEPWFSNSLGELKPTAELGGTYWDNTDGSLFGAYLTPGVVFTMFTNSSIQPYLAGSVGGILLTEDHIDDRELGSNALFRTKGAVGVQFGDGMQHRIQGDYTHHSTWGLSDKDDGFSTYGVSYGYSF